MSALPKAIQRQVDAAAQAEAAIAQAQADAADVLVTDPAQLVAANAEGGATPQDIGSSPAPAPAPAATPAPAPAEDWQQKYRSLQGLFAQKSGELQGQIKLYESQFAQMQQQIDALSRARPPEKVDQTNPKIAVDPADDENFGADYVEMTQRYAAEVFRQMAAPFNKSLVELDARLKALEGSVTGVKESTARSLQQQFYATLKEIVPDWETINTDQRWLEWLGEQDPVYGVARQAALDAAHKAGDATRVAAIFQAFRKAHPDNPKPSLANQVAPNGAAAPAPVAAPAKQILSAKFVEKFYRDIARGAYNGKDAEVARIEAEINQAAAEGRIR